MRGVCLNLVEQGSSWEEVVALARGACAAGANAIDPGMGWHEARIPTIASIVPPGAFSWVTRRLRAETGLPVIATNRINRPELAEALLAEGQADRVSLVRPFLADAEFAAKSAQGRGREINTCIGCNQSCLDRIFSAGVAGLAYWYALVPAHLFLFRGLTRAIVRRASAVANSGSESLRAPK